MLVMEKEIEKERKKVIKKLPNAKLASDEYGLYYISNDGEDIGEEYFLPHSPDILQAWKNALLTIRTTQQFNRTHPLRVEMDDFDKLNRVDRRRKAGRKPKQDNESNDFF